MARGPEVVRKGLLQSRCDVIAAVIGLGLSAPPDPRCRQVIEKAARRFKIPETATPGQLEQVLAGEYRHEQKK